MINGVIYVTINTDAGFRNGKGYYAYYIRTDRGVIKKADRLKTTPGESDEAEMMAIINGLHVATTLRETFAADIIHINTDSMTAINTLTKAHVKRKYRYLREQYDKIIRPLKQKIVFKHVKGHSKGKTPREYANVWCDKAIREIYKEEDKQLIIQKQ